MGLKSFLFGKKPKLYQPKHVGQADDMSFNAITGRSADAGQNLTGSSGVNKATQGFDFSPMNEAIQGFRNPSQMTETYSSGYKPSLYGKTNFNFQGLPSQYGSMAYESGAKDLRREGAGQLNQLQQSIGTRRPGLLMKAGQQAQRNLGEQLAGMRRDIGLEEMRTGVDAKMREQLAQAEENRWGAQFGEDQARFGAGEGFKEYGSRAEKEKFNAESRMNALRSLFGAGRDKIGTQSDLLENERGYQDKGIDYLMDYFFKSLAPYNEAEKTKGGGGFLNMLGKAAKAIM